MTVQLVWFKRDLRLDDHRPLAHAMMRGPTLGLFVFEPELLRAPETDPSHVQFVVDSLEELRASMRARGGTLLVRVGDAVDVLGRLHAQLGIGRLWSHEETGLDLTYARDRRVKRWAVQHGIEWTELPQHGVVRALGDRTGWSRRWQARMVQPAPPVPERILGPDVEVDAGKLPTLASLGLPPSEKSEAQAAGAEAGDRLLRSFLRGRGRAYRWAMSSPVEGWDACSRLSPHLAFGTVSLRRVFQCTELRLRDLRHEVRRGGGSSEARALCGSLEAFGERLRWHCHFMQKLESEPAIEFRNMTRSADGLRQEDPAAWSETERRRFEAWKTGQTGFVMVDACIRCLHRTGWVNFRMRAMLVSVLAYDLWLHWRPGAQELARHFLDFEPGIHFAQFQMQSGTTGINALRIYDPLKQARDQDPQGVFIRRWVPELEGVPDEYLHAPHTMPSHIQHRAGCVVGRDYPSPVVDHAAAARAARRRFQAIRRSAEGRADARRVFDRHGSRRGPRGRATRRSNSTR